MSTTVATATPEVCAAIESAEARVLYGITAASLSPAPEALQILERVAPLLDRVDDPLSKGKFFNELGIARRLTGDRDGAIIAYTGSKFWSREAGSPLLVAIADNNLAELLREVGQCDEAHSHIDEAISEFERLGEDVRLAQALDTKSLIYLTEQQFSEAATCALRSVNLLNRDEQKELLARSLINLAKALMGRGKYLEAHGRLEKAREIGDYLENAELLFDVAWELREMSKAIRTREEYSLITIALNEDSLRSAAKKMKVTHTALSKLVKKHGLQPPPYDPTRNFLRK